MAESWSYVCGVSDTPLLFETVGQVLARAARTHPEREAIVVRHQNVRWTWAEFAAEVDAVAAGLVALGLVPGDRIGIWSPNRVEWVLTQFATAKAGLILVNINPAYRLAELEYALNQVECKAIVIADRFKTSDYVGMLQTLAPELAASAPGALRSARLPHLRTVICMAADAVPGMLRFADLAAAATADSPSAWRRSKARSIRMTASTSSSPVARPGCRKVPR